MLKHLRRWRTRPAPVDYRELAENSSDVIFVVTEHGVATYVSPACERVFGWTPAEMTGSHAEQFLPPGDVAMVADANDRYFAGESGAGCVEYRVRHKDGGHVWVETNCSPVLDRGSSPRETVVTLRDVTRRKALEQRLADLAHSDGLTGLANRRAFDATLSRAWAAAAAEGGMLSLLLIDVDAFKAFNDRYGHQAGDDCLRTVAATIRGALPRPGDFAARYGGEEAAVLLPGAGATAARAAAEQIRLAIRRLEIAHGGAASGCGLLTVSIGVATVQPAEDASRPADLVRAADQALYRAKAAGRDRVEAAAFRQRVERRGAA